MVVLETENELTVLSEKKKCVCLNSERWACNAIALENI